MVCCLMWCCLMLRFVMWCCVVWCDAMLECLALHNIYCIKASIYSTSSNIGIFWHKKSALHIASHSCFPKLDTARMQHFKSHVRALSSTSTVLGLPMSLRCTGDLQGIWQHETQTCSWNICMDSEQDLKSLLPTPRIRVTFKKAA